MYIYPVYPVEYSKYLGVHPEYPGVHPEYPGVHPVYPWGVNPGKSWYILVYPGVCISINPWLLSV